MKLSHSLTPIESWPPAKIGDNTFAAQSYLRHDGMRIVHLAGPNDPETITETFEKDQTRVAYRVFEGKSLFLGMYLGASHRGIGLSDDILDYFVSNVGNIDGQFMGTGQINKPLIGLSLSRIGLKPLVEDFVVEVLPRSVTDSSRIPKVQIIKNVANPEVIIDKGPAGPFYEAVPEEEVIRYYPIGTPDRIIALHTEYDPVQ